jgi:hypothetical protein
VAVIHHALARGGSHEAAANDVDLHGPPLGVGCHWELTSRGELPGPTETFARETGGERASEVTPGVHPCLHLCAAL